MTGILPAIWNYVWGTQQSWTSYTLNLLIYLALGFTVSHWLFFESSKDYTKYKAKLAALFRADAKAARAAAKKLDDDPSLPPYEPSEIPQAGLQAAGGVPPRKFQ